MKPDLIRCPQRGAVLALLLIVLFPAVVFCQIKSGLTEDQITDITPYGYTSKQLNIELSTQRGANPYLVPITYCSEVYITPFLSIFLAERLNWENIPEKSIEQKDHAVFYFSQGGIFANGERQGKVKMYYSLFSNKNGTDIIKSVTMSGSWSMLMAFFIYFYPTYMHISPERNKLTYCSFWQDRITLGKMDQNGNGTLTIENSTIKTLAQYNAAIDKGRRNAGNSLQQVAQAPEDHEPIVTTVERDPEYPGDWKRYLETNLRTDVAIDSGAAAGSYQAIVQFVVDVQGMVSELKVLKDPGFGMGAEAMRVIKKSGKWKPAIQDGRQVKAYRKQPITFTIQKDAP